VHVTCEEHSEWHSQLGDGLAHSRRLVSLTHEAASGIRLWVGLSLWGGLRLSLTHEQDIVGDGLEETAQIREGPLMGTHTSGARAARLVSAMGAADTKREANCEQSAFNGTSGAYKLGDTYRRQ
jgi:hypothetical protein